jgi:hypothetical protein
MAEQQLSKQTKMAMASQFLGFMLDAYDMALVLVMAPILVKVFVSPKGSAAWQYIVIVFSYSIRIPVFYVLYHAAVQRNLWMAVVGTVMAAMLKLAWRVVPAYLCERFPTRRRAAGVGFGYSSGALLGAWFSVYVWWAHKIPFIAAIEKQDMWLSPAVILTIGSVMTFVSLWYSPETKDLQLDEVGKSDRAGDHAGFPEAVPAVNPI